MFCVQLFFIRADITSTKYICHMQNIILVAIGGALGSVLRYLLGAWVNAQSSGNWPLGTWLANVIGCICIGCLYGYFLGRSDELNQNALKLLFITGFCGGFTTFSTYSLEAVQLFRSGQTVLACVYLVSTVLCCLLGVVLGIAIMKH
jgi:fluoride exporter